MEFKFYNIWGLIVRSTIELSAGDAAPTEKYDLTVTEGVVSENLLDSTEYRGSFQYTESKFLFKSKNSGRFLLDGDTIYFERYEQSSYDDIKAILLSVVFGIFLHRKRKYPLHASAVLYHGKAILFSGKCGAGKSTFASILIRDGGTLISDDITVIDVVDDCLYVMPSYNFLKLWPDSMRALNLVPEEYKRFRPLNQKRQLNSIGLVPQPVEIQSIFFLSQNKKQRFSITDLDVSEKLRLLNAHTFRVGHMMEVGDPSYHFDMSCRIANQLKFKLLSRPIGVFDFDQTLELIKSEIID